MQKKNKSKKNRSIWFLLVLIGALLLAYFIFKPQKPKCNYKKQLAVFDSIYNQNVCNSDTAVWRNLFNIAKDIRKCDTATGDSLIKLVNKRVKKLYKKSYKEQVVIRQAVFGQDNYIYAVTYDGRFFKLKNECDTIRKIEEIQIVKDEKRLLALDVDTSLNKALTGGINNKLYLINLYDNSITQLNTLSHINDISFIKILDASTVITGGYDGIIKIGNIYNKLKFSTYLKPILQADYSIETNKMVIIPFNRRPFRFQNYFFVFDVLTHKSVKYTVDFNVTAGAFINGSKVALGSKKSVIIYNLLNREVEHKIDVGFDIIKKIFYLPEKNWLLISDNNSILYFLDVSNLRIIKKIRFPKQHFYSFAVKGNNLLLTNDNYVFLLKF